MSDEQKVNSALLKTEGDKTESTSSTKAKVGAPKTGTPASTAKKKGLDFKNPKHIGMVAGGVLAVLFLVILMTSLAGKAEREEQLRQQEHAAQQRAQEEEAKKKALEEAERAKRPPIEQLDAVRNLKATNPNHWVFVNAGEVDMPEISKNKLAMFAIEQAMVQSGRFVQGQGVTVNEGKALLPMNDPRLSTRLQRLQNEVVTALGSYSFQVMELPTGEVAPQTNELGQPIAPAPQSPNMNSEPEIKWLFSAIKDVNNRFQNSQESMNMIESSTIQAANIALQKMLSEIDNDPTIKKGSEGIITLVEEEVVEESPLAQEERKGFEEHIERLNKTIQEMDEKLAQEVEKRRETEAKNQEQTVFVANTLQRIEDSPNAKAALQAYDLNQILKGTGVKVSAVTGDVVYLEHKDGRQTTKRIGEVLNLDGLSVHLTGVDAESGFVMVVPAK